MLNGFMLGAVVLVIFYETNEFSREVNSASEKRIAAMAQIAPPTTSASSC